MNPSATVKNLVKSLHLKWLVGKNNKKNEIKLKLFGINRPGFELSGYFPSEYSEKTQKIMLLSSRENKFVNNLDHTTKIKRYEKLTSIGVPLFILTIKFQDDDFLEVARKNNALVALDASKNGNSDFIHKNILDYTDPFFSKYAEMHGSLVDVFGIGVLIRGVSGIGKSELILDLIKRNHLFIGDDRINICTRNHNLFGTNDKILQSTLEVRGIGIIDIASLFGYQYLLDEIEIQLVIELYDYNLVDQTKFPLERLGQNPKTTNLLGVEIPLVKIPLIKGRNLASLVETAVSKFKYERNKNDSEITFADELNARIVKDMLNKKTKIPKK